MDKDCKFKIGSFYYSSGNVLDAHGKTVPWVGTYVYRGYLKHPRGISSKSCDIAGWFYHFRLIEDLNDGSGSVGVYIPSLKAAARSKLEWSEFLLQSELFADL